MHQHRANQRLSPVSNRFIDPPVVPHAILPVNPHRIPPILRVNLHVNPVDNLLDVHQDIHHDNQRDNLPHVQVDLRDNLPCDPRFNLLQALRRARSLQVSQQTPWNSSS